MVKHFYDDQSFIFFVLFCFFQSTEQTTKTQADDEGAEKRPNSERPPFSYMAMIQFAINSRKNRRMTLKEIYTWFEDNFPYFREVAKPGWKVLGEPDRGIFALCEESAKVLFLFLLTFPYVIYLLQNSIRHNLSLHDMFIRETSLDGKISFWTIRPEANRCLTLEQVYKVG